MPNERLRVALISTPFVPVPPVTYGGTELFVGQLARALAEQGVEVVLYATGDSHLEGVEVRAFYGKHQWPPDPMVDRVHAAWALRDVAADPVGFDVVHVNSPFAAAAARNCPFPVICTVHHAADAEASALYRMAPNVELVAISESQRRLEKCRPNWMVRHGLRSDPFPNLPDQGYLLYLGRYSKVKGPHTAIEVAARAELPLVMAGEPHERDFFDQEVRPRIQQHGVLEVGPVGGRRKLTLLGRARALLFPIDWEEPFGLVMIEAMHCGVPVLALSRGSVPEVIEDGVTGLLCDDPSELVAGARVAEKLFDRARIRQVAQEKWTDTRMADEYLRIYAEMAETAEPLVRERPEPRAVTAS